MLQKTLQQSYNFNTLFKETIKKWQITPLIVTGPSGAGKSTFVDKLIQESHPNKFKQTVNYTSRAPRPMETHGKDYYFITPELFLNMIDKQSFIEYSHHYQTYYGSSREEVIRIIQKEEKIPVFVIDIKGSINIIENIEKINRIFIAPPTVDTLRQRLVARGTETPEKIDLRMAKAQEEMEMVKNSGYYDEQDVIINDQFENSYQNFLERVEDLCEIRNNQKQLQKQCLQTEMEKQKIMEESQKFFQFGQVQFA